MWLFTSIIFAALSLPVLANTEITAQVFDIDYGKKGEETLLLLTTGHVARVQNIHKNLASYENARQERSWIKFQLNSEREIISAQVVPARISSKNKSLAFFEEDLFEPTLIESMDQARAYFADGRYVNKESQCYNRAHIWSYEWFTKHSILSNKTWLFFTRKYIRKYKFEWWFHVAPSVKVMDAGIAREKIMDVKYARGPIDLKRWTDIFMLNDAHCPLVKTYSDYANYPESGWCYTMRTSMFYYQPYDIEMKETWGAVRGNWNESDIRAAYAEAFDEQF